MQHENCCAQVDLPFFNFIQLHLLLYLRYIDNFPLSLILIAGMFATIHFQLHKFNGISRAGIAISSISCSIAQLLPIENQKT